MDSEHKCQHNLPARIWTSNKQLGRQFYRCPKPIGEQCPFFSWVTDSIPSPSQNRVLPLTPQSTQTSAATFHDSPSTPTSLSRKRNSPDNIPGSPTLFGQCQKRARHGDDTQDAEGRISQGPGRFITGLSTSMSASVPDAGPSMSQETVRSEGSEEWSADSVAKKLQALNELPEYIRKLERRKVAAEKSRDAKARKIVDLEAEVQRLKQREKELEELIVMLESAQN